jgi:Fe-S-cluster containining protein
MRCLRCGVCCSKTEMLLATVDVERLTRKGYSVEFFARFGRDGYVTLRNRRGRCVFYDVAKHCCRVYADRPLGCRIYPVMHDEDKGIVVDGICPARGTVTEKQKVKLGEKVLKLLEKIDAEAEERCSA